MSNPKPATKVGALHSIVEYNPPMASWRHIGFKENILYRILFQH
jgi:hypothetical protein